LSERAALIGSVLSLALFGVGPCHALSLRSSAAEIFLGDVRQGKVSAAGLKGPLSVVNTGNEKAVIEVSAENPPAERLKDGYDPLPDVLKQVVVKGPSRPLEPGEKSVLDIVVALPAGLEGGQYQFDCVLKGRNAGGSALTLRTAVTMSVGEVNRADIAREPEGSGFSVSPAKAHLEGVPLGGREAARSEKFPGLKLANAGESVLVVSAKPVRVWDESVRIEDGYAPAPNPNWLKTGPAHRIKPGEVAEASFVLEIPRQKRYRGRKWAFVVAVDAEGSGRIGRTWWTLYVRTQDEEGSRNP
jgi:hypothetical protein